MCGTTTEALYTAVIENVEMKVCRDCVKYGKVISAPREPVKTIKRRPQPVREEEPETLKLVVEDYPSKLKSRREQLGMSQKDFAKHINEKESVVHSLERGSLKPSLELARKLEKKLGVRLIEEHTETRTPTSSSKSESFTLGDFIKIRK